MSDHKCIDQRLEEFNTGVYEDRAKRGFHPYNYETHLKLKFLKKHYWLAARGLAAWLRWKAKQPQNRVLRQRVRDDKGRVLSETTKPWPEPLYCSVFVPNGVSDSRRERGWPIPRYLSDHGILDAYEKSRMPRLKEDVALFKPTLIESERIDELYEAVSKWQAEGILDLIQRAA